jgi:hypothetical protein
LENPVPFKGRLFNKKKLSLHEGTPLPATFEYGNGAFIFVVGQDLSVTFNGIR